MLKLKVGKNYLYTHKELSKLTLHKGLSFMMSNLEGENKVCFILERKVKAKVLEELVKSIRQDRVSTLYVLTFCPTEDVGKAKVLWVRELKNRIKEFRYYMAVEYPELKINFIKMDVSYNRKGRSLASTVLEGLSMDKNSIYHYYDVLDDYKNFKQRMEQIPAEIKAIDEGISSIKKKNKTCERKIGLKTLEPLKLIKKAEISGQFLVLVLHPQKIKPSEKLGSWITKTTFENNKYIREVAKHLYSGYDFGIKETVIKISPDFKPIFVDTLDHGFDHMMRKNNWSSVGFLHFGIDHLCGGEFNDVIARAREYGLEYYFIAFKQYITTANVRDYAGKKVWWYPIYDEDGKIVYCASLDMYRDHIPNEEHKERCKSMTWEELLDFSNRHKEYWDCIPSRYNSSELPTSFNQKEDGYLKYLEEHDIELYNFIKERNN
jgi:hypothetical protein